MAILTTKSFVLAVLTVTSFINASASTRSFNKRSDLENIKPVADSGYTVPLEAGKYCQSAGKCSSTLLPPASYKVLRALSIARGVLTYSCENANSSDVPEYLSQFAELWDVAALITYFPSEDSLHELVTLFYQFDYTQLKNSTMTCLGTIYTEGDETVCDLGKTGRFSVRVNEAFPPPDLANLNAWWVHSGSSDEAWDVYRVETAGGAMPSNCRGQNDTFELSYAAEYWFYHV